MGKVETAAERVREIFLKGGRDLPSCFAVHDYLDAIPADSASQIAALKAQVVEIVARQDQIISMYEDLESDLATNAAMLARQTDLAREAENERDKAQRLLVVARSQIDACEDRVRAADTHAETMVAQRDAARAQAEALARALGRVRHHEISDYVALLIQAALDEYRESTK